MKKNKMMRIASILMVVTLLSTCAISGTFAKYVTKASGEDQARVAKWGVLISINGGDLFEQKYPAEDEAYLEAGGEYSVESSNDDKVVAPGTSSDQIDKSLTAKVTGTPEVATRYILEGKKLDDIVLKAGTYTDYTHLVLTDGEYAYSDKFILDADYSPVKWNLTIKKGDTEFNVAEDLYAALEAQSPELLAKAEALGFTEKGCSIFSAISILKKVAGNYTYVQVVETALGNIVSGGRNFQLEATDDTFKMSYDFDPNKEMGFEFTLSWEWAFENGEEIMEGEGDDAVGTGIFEFDAADTFLGNVAAGVIEEANANTTIGASLTATAVQID